jgi:hypothetical protein
MSKSQLILDGSYRVLLVVPGPVFYKGQTIDLSNLSAAAAESLSTDANFKYLEKVKVSKPKKTDEAIGD